MGRLGKVGGSVDASQTINNMTDRTYSTTGTNNVTSDYEGYANPLPVYADKMIVDNTVQKETKPFTPGFLNALVDLANQSSQPVTPEWKPSTIDYNFPEVHTTATRGGTFTDLGNPMFYGNPHRSNLK